MSNGPSNLTAHDEFRIAEIVESRMLTLRARLRAELATELHAQFVATFDERIAKLELDQEVLWDDMQERRSKSEEAESEGATLIRRLGFGA